MQRRDAVEPGDGMVLCLEGTERAIADAKIVVESVCGEPHIMERSGR